MPTFFISHSSRDESEVVGLREWLERQGVLSLFVAVDPERGIPPGARGEAELYAQLRRADAVLFVGSAASVASQWCFAELAMARSLGKTIIPVTLGSGGNHPLLADTQAVSLVEGNGRGLQQLGARLRAAD